MGMVRVCINPNGVIFVDELTTLAEKLTAYKEAQLAQLNTTLAVFFVRQKKTIKQLASTCQTSLRLKHVTFVWMKDINPGFFL